MNDAEMAKINETSAFEEMLQCDRAMNDAEIANHHCRSWNGLRLQCDRAMNDAEIRSGGLRPRMDAGASM